MCVFYVDNTMFWSPDDTKINQTISELKGLNFGLIDKREMDSFLDIKIDTVEDEIFTVCQPVLVETVINRTRSIK